MSFKEVMKSRGEGNLEEARKVAKEDLSNALNLASDNKKDNEVMWAKRAMSWVYYDTIKKSVAELNPKVFIDTLKKTIELDLDKNENMFFDQVIWQIGSIIFKLQDEKGLNLGLIGTIFDYIKGFHFTKSSEGYSFLFKSFHKGYKKWNRYIEFTEWWGLENFLDEDYKKEKLPNGRMIISLVERAHIAYAKNLLIYSDQHNDETSDEESKKEFVDLHGNIISRSYPRKPSTVEVTHDRIEEFLIRLDKVIEEYPDYKYLPYFKAKLLLSIGEKKDSLDAIIPFAREKQNEYWVWELMADAFPDNDDRKLSCYCKALTTKSADSFLVKTRKKLAEILIGRQAFDQAKTEIQKVIETRYKNDWKISSTLLNWTESKWYKEAKGLGNNHQYYEKHVQAAEKLLVKDIPEVTVAVEFVNTNKKMINFIESKNNVGFFKYEGHLKEVGVGDILKIRLKKISSNGYCKVISARIDNNADMPNVIKTFRGDFNVIPNQSFGFVGDIFVAPDMIEKKELSTGHSVIGKSILSYDKKKNRWGWKAFEIRVEV